MIIVTVRNRNPSVASVHELLFQAGDTIGEVARALIEDVHDAIFDLVELIKTYQNKNKFSKLFVSTLFKRRQEELHAVVDRAITRLQVSGSPCLARFAQLAPSQGVFSIVKQGMV